MNGWIVFVGISIPVWLFCAVRVREVMRRRCHMRDEQNHAICTQLWGSEDDAHTWGTFLGFALGPIMLGLVAIYELADGTTRRCIKKNGLKWPMISRDARRRKRQQSKLQVIADKQEIADAEKRLAITRRQTAEFEREAQVAHAGTEYLRQ